MTSKQKAGAEGKDSGQPESHVGNPPREESLEKPPTFLCGVAISVYQNSGDPNTNWAWFEKQTLAVARFRLRLSTGDLNDNQDDDDTEGGDHLSVQSIWKGLGPSRIVNGARIGNSSDFWNLYEEDLLRCKNELKCNSIRLSLEWSRCEPKHGEWDMAAVAHYHKIFDCIDRLGMECNVTLHWFVHPKWFEDLGAFTNMDNIPLFVRWAEFAFKHFGNRSRLWATFNEPGVASMCGFITGNHPPGKILKFRQAGTNLMGMMRCHTAAYKAIKALPGGDKALVGLVHNVWWMEPKRGGPFYAHVRAAVGFANHVWGNEYVTTYLKTGYYHYWVPFGKNIRYQEPDGKPGCDFFGLNHYARAVADWKLMPAVKGGKGLADMGYPVYPPSLYRAISYSSILGVPIYIMENGMPCAADDERRQQWIDGAMQQVERAVRDGYDVRGYMYWTLVDNFEWNFAWDLKFGLYEWAPGNDQKRRLRDGAKAIIKYYEEYPRKLGDLLASNVKPGVVKEESERQALEQAAEEEWLRGEGWPEHRIKGLMAQDSNPIIAGVY